MAARVARKGWSLSFILAWVITATASEAQGAPCAIQANSDKVYSLSGRLTYHVFPGAPNFADVRKGDAPEPAYILRLDEPLCATGTTEGTTPPFDRVQLTDEGPAPKLRSFIGQHVVVTAAGGDVGITAHYHAPFIAAVVAIEPDAIGRPDEGYPAINAVRAFYEALGAGDGAEAARFVVPGKRKSGPMSAEALTGFYAAMSSPIVLESVRPLSQDMFEVKYHYRISEHSKECNGKAIALTSMNKGLNLISGIRAVSSC